MRDYKRELKVSAGWTPKAVAAKAPVELPRPIPTRVLASDVVATAWVPLTDTAESLYGDDPEANA
jgi:hypothetical protein